LPTLCLCHVGETRNSEASARGSNAEIDFAATASAASPNGGAKLPGRFCESFGADSSGSSSRNRPHRTFPAGFAQIFFEGRIRCSRRRVLRAARAAGTLSRGDARPGTSKFAHHRNGHLTGVFAIFQIPLA
jgi:hypothetical protein